MRQLVGADDQQLMGQNAVDLTEFLKFNKISQMTQKAKDICLALESSECLCLDQNELKVRRKEPFINKDKNFSDDSTIYVEGLPPNADHNWVRMTFEPFGRIDYIKIPKFKHNHNIMGFAFIEFSQPEAVQKAVKHFNRSSEPKNETTEADKEKTSLLNSENGYEVPRKRSRESKEEESVALKKAKLSDENEVSDKEMVTETKDIEINQSIKKKKKKRKRKRKSMAIDAAEDEPEVLHLRVMSKDEWKRWKKEYLKLQKQTMSSIKRSLLPENNTTKELVINKEISDKSFESGLIIKLNFTLPSSDLNEQQFKRNIRQIGDKNNIQYIDLPLNRIQFKDNQTVDGVCYVRTKSSQDCRQLASNEKLKQLGQIVILEGNEETDYWTQIFERRDQTRSRSDECNGKSRHKVRGFDRIIRRVENVRTDVETKHNKHIKFESNSTLA